MAGKRMDLSLYTKMVLESILMVNLEKISSTLISEKRRAITEILVRVK